MQEISLACFKLGATKSPHAAGVTPAARASSLLFNPASWRALVIRLAMVMSTSLPRPDFRGLNFSFKHAKLPSNMNTEAERIIQALGGTSATAEFFRVYPGAVSQWRHKGIPKARLQTLSHSHPQLFQRPAKRKAA